MKLHVALLADRDPRLLNLIPRLRRRTPHLETRIWLEERFDTGIYDLAQEGNENVSAIPYFQN